MDNKLFVGNLPWSATEEDLNQLFSQFGTVESVEVLRDKFTNRARGFGFVTMSNGDEANAAVAGTEGQDFMGRPLKVNVARPREEGADRPRRSFDGPRTGGFGGGAPREGGFGGGERRSFGGPREGGFGGGQGGYAPRQGGFGAPRQGGFGGGAPRQGGFGGGQGGFGGGQGGGQGGYRFKPKPRRDFGGDEG